MQRNAVTRERLGSLVSGLVVGLVAAVLLTQGVLARPAPSPQAVAPVDPAPAALGAEPAPVWAAALAGQWLLADAADAQREPADAVAVVSEQAGMTPALRTRTATVPFRTQRDGSRFAGSNCGPAALAIVLEAYDISQENDELRYLTHTYQGTWGRRGGTALQHMAQVAEDFGLRTDGLYAGEEFRHWSVADVRAQVEAGHPVIALVKYRLLPDREYSTVRYDHYVVLWDTTADGFIYNDPIYPAADEGFARFMTSAQLDAAMAPTMEPRQAVAIY
jgi:hypothetical protein